MLTAVRLKTGAVKSTVQNTTVAMGRRDVAMGRRDVAMGRRDVAMLSQCLHA